MLHILTGINAERDETAEKTPVGENQVNCELNFFFFYEIEARQVSNQKQFFTQRRRGPHRWPRSAGRQCALCASSLSAGTGDTQFVPGRPVAPVLQPSESLRTRNAQRISSGSIVIFLVLHFHFKSLCKENKGSSLFLTSHFIGKSKNNFQIICVTVVIEDFPA